MSEMNELEKLSVVQQQPTRRTIVSASHGALADFLRFIRERGVMGLAIGFVLGGAVSRVTTSFSSDVVNPLLSYFFGGTERLGDIAIGSVAIGKFLASILDFFVLALVVYIIFRALKLNTLDKPKG